MDKKTLHGMWNYFLMLESDLDNTSRYIEPLNQENVYSFEFAKILILACTEVEAVFKAICHEIDDSQTAGDIGKYKSIILGRYPKIVNTKVSAKRLGRDIYPFAGWDRGPLLWWNGYNDVKHNRVDDRWRCFWHFHRYACNKKAALTEMISASAAFCIGDI